MFKTFTLVSALLAGAGAYAQESFPQPPAPPPPVANPTEPTCEIDKRIEDALNGKSLMYTLLQPRKIFRVGWTYTGGRHQNALIGSFNEKLNTNDPQAPSIRRIWSIAYSGPGLPSNGTLAKLMIESAKNKIGAWEIVKEGNGDYTVLFNIKADADTPPDTLVWMAMVAAHTAEAAEKEHEAVEAAAHASDPSYKPVIDKY